MKNRTKKLSLITLLLFMIFSASANASTLLKKHFTKEELKTVNTAVGEDYLTDEEKKVIQYLNLARVYPAKFAAFYVNYLRENDEYGYNKYKRKNKYYYGLYKDLLALEQENRKAMVPNRELHDYAKCWAQESGSKGITGHNRRKCNDGSFAECCSYMWALDAMEHILLLLIDEDIASLGHRNIMLSGYEAVGVSFQRHKGYGHVLVMDFYFTDPNKEKVVSAN